ncbi:MAG: diguanylate cyclase domain-containing protein [Candidatus Acetothermia bacterium]
MRPEVQHVHEKQDYLDRVFKGDSETRLLATFGTTEVLLQTIPEGKEWKLYPFSGGGGFEFLYLLDGEVVFTEPGPKKVLGPGDYVTRGQVSTELWFRTRSESRLLWFASQPVFRATQEEIESFKEKAKKVEKIEGMENHSKNLEELAVRLGRKLGLTSEQLFNLHYSAYFHDIGKEKVPEKVLRKEGELTDEEWETMKKHPVWGKEILEEKEFLEEAAEIVAQHHERIDGDGYPEGLEGREISIEARIISVVDAYDAMRTDRAYRGALTKEESVEELRENAGTQFDENVVEAFLELITGGEERDNPDFDLEAAYLQQRKYFLDLGEKVLAKADVDDILPELARAVVDTSPFQRVIISLYEPSIRLGTPEGNSRVVHFSSAGLTLEERKKLEEAAKGKPPVNPAKFDERFKISNSYYVPHDAALEDEDSSATTITSSKSEEETEDWHPDDKLYVPLTSEDEVMGHISVDDPIDGRAPTVEKLQLMEGLANLGSLAIAKTQRIKELNEQKENIRTLHDLGKRFMRAINPEQLYYETTELLGDYFDYEFCSILINQDGKLRRAAHQSRFEGKDPVEAEETLEFGEGLIGWVAEKREPVLLGEVQDDPRYTKGRDDVKSELAVPVVLDGELIGVLDIQSKYENNFTEDELELLDVISIQLSIAISNIRRKNELKEQATKDPLTGVFNRRYFSSTIEKEIERSHRYSHPMGIMMTDINNFKRINDVYSHVIGDRVLVEIAKIFQQETRDADTVVRYGGDEYLVLFPETGEKARRVAERIEARIQDWNESNDLIDEDLTISKGFAFWFPDGGKDIDEVIKEADNRMYRDKGRHT